MLVVATYWGNSDALQLLLLAGTTDSHLDILPVLNKLMVLVLLPWH